MKKILILCTLAIAVLSGCTQSKIVNPTVAEGEPEYDLSAIGDELNKLYTGNEAYPGIEVAFRLDSGAAEANFGLTVKEGTTPEEASDYARTILMAFNDLIAEQDSSIDKSKTGYLGGFYENYTAEVKVSPEDKKSDSEGWLLDTTIMDPTEEVLSVAEEERLKESESLEEDKAILEDEDQDVEHGPGTVPTEPAVLETKPEA